MKTLLLFSVLASTLAFGQSNELNEKQAYELFKRSNVRIALGLKDSDFKENYQILKPLKRDALILSNMDKKNIEKLIRYKECETKTYERYASNNVSIPLDMPKQKFIKYFNSKCEPTN